MDYEFTDQDTATLMRMLGVANSTTINDDEPKPVRLGFGEMLDRIETSIKADSALRAAFAARFARYINATEGSKVSLAPFPVNVGTVELSIWDNQPGGKRKKIEGDTSREKPARYALDMRACKARHTKPLTTKTPDFRANVGDLFTADEVRARLKKAWKGMDAEEAAFLRDEILPIAEAGFLVARLCYKRSAKAGGGTHWHAYHFALVNAQQLEDRNVDGVLIITREGSWMLPPASTLDAKSKPFQMVTKETRSGAKNSIVVGQSRATDLTTTGMKAWATGAIRTAH